MMRAGVVSLTRARILCTLWVCGRAAGYDTWCWSLSHFLNMSGAATTDAVEIGVAVEEGCPESRVGVCSSTVGSCFSVS
eukprot:5183922-Lingulodinium_polyedra.AAC.1